MSFKKLLLKGILSLAIMGSTQAAPVQTPGFMEGNGNIVLVDWWGHHHHHHDPYFYPHPYVFVPEYPYPYHETFERLAEHCRKHPHHVDCQQFCASNPQICYPFYPYW